MTINEIVNLDREFLTPAEAAKTLGMSPQYLRVAARDRPDLLPFPVILSGNRCKIPKQAFLHFLLGEPKD